jgi:hypothetical protein
MRIPASLARGNSCKLKAVSNAGNEEVGSTPLLTSNLFGSPLPGLVFHASLLGRAIVLLTGDDGALILDEVAAILYDLPSRRNPSLLTPLPQTLEWPWTLLCPRTLYPTPAGTYSLRHYIGGGKSREPRLLPAGPL